MGLLNVSLALLAVLAAATYTDAGGGCEVPITSKYGHQWPLVFRPSGELYPTTSGNEPEQLQVRIDSGTDVLLSCGPNYLKRFNRKEVLSVRCNGASGNFTIAASNGLKPTESEVSINELDCDLRVIEEVVGPVDGCAAKRTSTKFGYVDPVEKLTYILGEACYDTEEGRTLFAHIKVGDKASDYLQKVDRTYLTKNRHPDGRYKIELFRGLHFDEIYERIRKQLKVTKAPSLNMAHFIDETLLSNAQFQAVKKLGWNYYVARDSEVLNTLQQDIKRLSERLNLDVYVGSHGVMQLHGSNDERMELYLHPNRFPVPEHIWILVRHQDKATAFVVSNNAGNMVDPTMPVLCRSDCSKVTWLSASLTQEASLLCCDYINFQETVSEAPRGTMWEDVKEMFI